MSVGKYPKDVYDLVKENAAKLKDAEMAVLLNERYSEYRFTADKVRMFRKNHKIKTGRKGGIEKGRCLKYPQELRQFVIENAAGKTTEELTEMINKTFGDGTITLEQARSFKKRNHICSGLDCRFKKGQPSIVKGRHINQPESVKHTQFKKGNIPKNVMGIGTISKTTDGYLIIKVKNSGTQAERWKFLHRYIWEKEKGEIPSGKIITFLDGNRENCDISNLELIDNKINLELQRKKLRTGSRELTGVGITLAKLAIATREKRRGNGQRTL